MLFSLQANHIVLRFKFFVLFRILRSMILNNIFVIWFIKLNVPCRSHFEHAVEITIYDHVQKLIATGTKVEKFRNKAISPRSLGFQHPFIYILGNVSCVHGTTFRSCRSLEPSSPSFLESLHFFITRSASYFFIHHCVRNDVFATKRPPRGP